MWKFAHSSLTSDAIVVVCYDYMGCKLLNIKFLQYLTVHSERRFRRYNMKRMPSQGWLDSC